MLLLVLLFALIVLATGNPVDERVVGGKVVQIKDYPYQVSLRYYDGNHFCGGSLVTSTHVVTAAHCTKEKNLKLVTVKVGISTIDEDGIEIPVKDAIIHDGFDFGAFDYDISIIKLKDPAPLGPTVSTINLPKKGDILPVGTKCTVTGWGYTAEGSGFSDKLHKAEVPIVNHNDCIAWYKPFNDVVTDRMICAGYDNGGIDACQGDSGGPLVYKGVLVGVVSFGEGCAKPKQPGIYTNVAYLIDYINDAIKKLG